MLPEIAYIEFQQLFEKNYGRKISLEEAKEKADGFFNLMSEIYTGLEKRYHEDDEKTGSKTGTIR